MAIDSRALGGAIVRKSIVINSSQNWTAPANLAGNTAWLTGCAGGGSGAQMATDGSAMGGFGGAYCMSRPIVVTPSTTYAVVIPAGGVGVSSGGGNSGGDLTFGALVTLKGGKGGQSPSTGVAGRWFEAIQSLGVRPNIYYESPTTDKVVAYPADTVNGNVCGVSLNSAANAYTTGGACGLFGNGGDSSFGTTGGSAAANTGAGGGAVRNASGTSGAGGSGRLIIEWDEFL